MHTIICFYAWAGHNTDTEARPDSCKKRKFSQSSNRDTFLPNYFIVSRRHTETQGLHRVERSISKALSHLPSSAHTHSFHFFQITVSKPEGVSLQFLGILSRYLHTHKRTIKRASTEQKQTYPFQSKSFGDIPTHCTQTGTLDP